MSQREHGTRTKYVHDDCRCQPCVKANRDYNRANRRALLYDRLTLVTAAPSYYRLNALSEAGIGYKQVARLTGIGKTALLQILVGETQRVHPETERAILAVPFDSYADGAYIDGQLTWRRIEGLLALGYPKSWIAAELGLGLALQIRPDRVTARNARKVLTLAKRIGDRPGPSPRTAAIWRQRGCQVPAEWDDDYTSLVATATATDAEGAA